MRPYNICKCKTSQLLIKGLVMPSFFQRHFESDVLIKKMRPDSQFSQLESNLKPYP